MLCIGIMLMALTSHTYADERIDVRLNNYGKTKEVIKMQGAYENDICRIEATLKDVDDNGSYTIELTVENLDEQHVLYLFGSSLTKKQLRKLTPSVVYYSGFVESFTKKCNPLNDKGVDHARVLPNESITMEIKGSDNVRPMECAIPLYFAKPKGVLWKRDALLDVRVELLNFIVDLKPSLAYSTLAQEVDDVVITVSKTKYVVCKHQSGKKHNDDLEQQKSVTRKQLDAVLEKINKEMAKLNPSSGNYAKFVELKERIESIDLEKIQVVKCPIQDKGCSCPQRIADMSLSQISYRMEELYLKIHNGESTKNDVIGEVKALKTHSGHIKNDPKHLKKGIDRYYNRINSL